MRRYRGLRLRKRHQRGRYIGENVIVELCHVAERVNGWGWEPVVRYASRIAEHGGCTLVIRASGR